MKNLKSILKSFYLLSGMNMTIFDIHQNVVVSYPDKKCPLCYLLDQYKDARNKCTKCDMEAMEHVFQSSQIYVGYISKMVNSRNRINEKIIFLHVNNTEEICDLMHSFLD